MRTDTTHLRADARAALADRGRAAPTLEHLRQRGTLAAAEATASRPPAGARGLRVVDDATPAPPRPASRPVASALSVTALPRLDRQDRVAAKPVLAELGFGPDTALAAHVDVAGARVWVQPQQPPLDGDCDCHRCRAAAAEALTLPGQVTPSPERVAVDADARLVLSAGLRHAAGAPPRGQVLLGAVPERHALLVCAPQALLADALAGADGDDDRFEETAAAPQRRMHEKEVLA